MNQYLKFALAVAEKTGRNLKSNFGKLPSTKRGSAKSIKSVQDKIADDFIIKNIQKKFTAHSYLTEETGFVNKKSDFLWIIDPLDGTRNYENGNPFYAVSIALWFKNEPLLGVIEAPSLNERYIAQKNRPAFLENTAHKLKIAAKVSDIKDLNKAYLVYCSGAEENQKKILKLVNELYPRAKDMRKLGSAALELAYVGVGRAEGYITPKISLWDIAAGILFVKQAGGQITDFSGQPHEYHKLALQKQINLIASNGKVKMPDNILSLTST